MSDEDDLKPGWFEQEGALRRWDGEQWTDQWLPLPGPRLSGADHFGAVFFAIIAAWLALRIGADLAPNFFFVPIKVVVDPSVLNHLN